MDAETSKAFVAHVRDLEDRAMYGDLHAAKSLACMSLLAEGFRPSPPDGGGEVIDFIPFLNVVLKAA